MISRSNPQKNGGACSLSPSSPPSPFNNCDDDDDEGITPPNSASSSSPRAMTPAPAMKILYNPAVLAHSPMEMLGSKLLTAYESPQRIESILTALEKHELANYITTIELDVAFAEEAALAVHTPEYIEHLKTVFASWEAEGLIESGGCILPECFPVRRLASGGQRVKPGPPRYTMARVGYYAFDMSTGITEHTYNAALSSAHTCVAGASSLLDTPEELVFCLTRPPGHHCSEDLAGGYCYLNNTAIAVKYFLSQRPDAQVSILDLDFHHGNGTQEIFYSVSSPCYVSIHGEDEYPYYTGGESEIGEGDGEGYNLNLPLPANISGIEEYLEKLEPALEKITNVGTEYLVISLGFDTFHLDPIGRFLLETDHYRLIAERIADLGLPTMVILEGGYCLEHLGENVVSFLKGLRKEGVAVDTNGY
ncbi:hypothetical protein RUND412_010355 [Rhizina undulata]